MVGVDWIYLSPHLDDAVYSCGGLVWDQTAAGDYVEIWTVCTADPPPGALSPFAELLHERWGVGSAVGAVRRAEDQRAASRLGASVRHLGMLDCIYRQYPASGEAIYPTPAAIFGEINPVESPLLDELSKIFSGIPKGAQVVCPLALGGHVDHRFVRKAAEKAGYVSWHYADYPYAIRVDTDVNSRLAPGSKEIIFPISENGMHAWAEGITVYASQLSSFWQNREAMEKELHNYVQASGGLRLWKRKIGSSESVQSQ